MRTKNRRTGRLALVAAILALPLVACGSQVGDPPLAGARIGGPFSLLDQDGKRTTDAAFAGKYRLVYFGYSYCPDVCPTDLALISAGLAFFEKSDPARAARVQPLFVSIDPARDTPARLKQYIADFHPRLIALTGSAAEVAAVARAYGVPYNRGEGTGENYLMDHGTQVYLMGPDGAPIALMPTEAGTVPAAFANELERWVR